MADTLDIADRDVPRKATRREWIGLGVIALPCLLYSMDLTVLNLAVPAITADLNPSATELLWIVDIYGFMIAGMLITMGTLGDRIGRRKLLMIGAFAFGLASIVAAFASSAGMLIVARALLGLSAATLAPSTLSLISNMFPDPKERTFAIGVWISSFSAGGAIGPVIGGVLLTWFWWGSVFLIAVPVMILLLAVAPSLLPEYRDENAGRIDLASAALSLAAVLATIYGIKHAASYAFDAEAVAAILAGLAIGIVFVRRQRRLAEPLIDLNVFRSLTFSASLGINVLGFFAAFGIFLLTAQYLQLVLGLSPLAAGLWSAPSSIGFIIGSLLAPKLLGSMRPAYVMAGGYAVTAASFLLMAQAASTGSLHLLVASYVVMSFGLAPIFTLSTDLIIGTVPPERAGTAAGLAETSSEFGGALGIAILGSIVTAIYASGMAAFDSGGLSSDVVAAVRETIGGAVAEAANVGGAAGDLLLAEAREAYAAAFRSVALVCAVVSLLAGLVALLVLGRVKPDAGADCDEKERSAKAAA
ncbi:MFS transporter [Mesorhizobium sp. ZMM04-5]|uniref:MFS transporter n=1 Tax=Mesorhizobium marinum TaxID=3228790 RepID=A0ABV3QX60_9HYPH